MGRKKVIIGHRKSVNTGTKVRVSYVWMRPGLSLNKPGFFCFLLIVMLFTACTQKNKVDSRKTILFNDNWEFVKDMPPRISNGLFNKNDHQLAWQKVMLPHTAHIEPLVIKGQQWQGNCFYRKFFSIPAIDTGKQILLKVDGAMQVAKVYLNGKFLELHNGGYLPFVVDLTGKIKPDTTNCLLVWLNNEDDSLVPPGKPIKTLDFNYYGGLYRDVHLILKNKLHITDEAESDKAELTSASKEGITVWYSDVSDQSATVHILSEIANDLTGNADVKVEYQLTRMNGTPVDKATVSSTVPAGKKQVVSGTIRVNSPALWSPDRPNLYWLNVELIHHHTIVDNKKLKIGIRSVKITRKDGLLINGKPIKIRGTNRHQDYPYIGYALSDNANYRDAYKIKMAGFNFVRLSHYPQTTSFLDACDELGIMVMDAIPGWQFFGDSTFQNNSIMDVRNMVRRDRNHPSIILWEASLNESPMSKKFMQRACDAVHEELPYPGVYASGWLNHVYDVFIPSRQASRPPYYWNKYDGKRPLLIAEYGDWEYYAQNAGLHQTEFSNLKKKDRSSRQLRGYGQIRLAQQALNFQEAHNSDLIGHNLGDANWLMFDYNRGYAPDIEASGVMDIFRLPKFSFYFFRSQVIPDPNDTSGFRKPMIYIANYWNDPNYTRVKIYSNCDEVGLYLNGKLIGRHKPDTGRNSTQLDKPPFTFSIQQFEPGTLTAKGYIQGKVAVTATRETPGTPSRIKLNVDLSNKPLEADRNDVVFVYARIIDNKGTVVPDNGRKVHFGISGDGELIGQNPAVEEAGIATILLRAGKSKGPITITAKSENLAGASFVVDAY